MSFLELFTLSASAITIFGLIVGVFSVSNGRMTRQEITAVIRETQQLIVHEMEATRELIARETEVTRQFIRETHEATRQILQGITEILARTDERVR